jgi:hypothetical protein
MALSSRTGSWQSGRSTTPASCASFKTNSRLASVGTLCRGQVNVNSLKENSCACLHTYPCETASMRQAKHPRRPSRCIAFCQLSILAMGINIALNTLNTLNAALCATLRREPEMPQGTYSQTFHSPLGCESAALLLPLILSWSFHSHLRRPSRYSPSGKRKYARILLPSAFRHHERF